MKFLLSLCLIFCSTFSAAKSIKLYSIMSGFSDDIETKFMINKDLGRAWVNVITINDWDDDVDETDHFIKVDGLSYDQDTQEVVYNDGNNKVVCASFSSRGRGIFRTISLRNTRSCFFKIDVEYKKIDDGFYVKTKKYEVVSLEIDL